MATTTKNTNSVNDAEQVSTGRKRLLKVSKAEFDGIRNILANPEPPSSEMTAQWKEYLRLAADDSDANW